ncbi:MAG: hypothetical protein RLZZ124_561 [Cyanobacteriota bacterium]
MLLIADHHQEHGLSSCWISERLEQSLSSLDSAFLQCRGRNCTAAIQSYRLSRLFDQITAMPDSPLPLLVSGCGFASVEEADQHFLSEFGIALDYFHAISRKAAADRCYRRSHPGRRDLIVNE